MTSRLAFAIITTMLEEAALAAVLLWGIPWLGIRIPLPLAIAILALWLGWSILTYLLGSHALKRKQPLCLPSMPGSKGKVISPLTPDGIVRINGELWHAKSASGVLMPGNQIIVVAQDGLKLIVRSVHDIDKTV